MLVVIREVRFGKSSVLALATSLGSTPCLPLQLLLLTRTLHRKNLRMAEGEGSEEPKVPDTSSTREKDPRDGTTKVATGEVEEQEEEETDEEEEPRLKYAPVTNRLSSLYRNGDAVSAFLVAGDKMVCLITLEALAQSNIPLTRCW